MKAAVLKETLPGEKRVALTPDSLGRLGKKGFEAAVEAGAGANAGFADSDYAAAGVRVEADRGALLADAQVVVKVQPPVPDEVAMLPEGTALVAMLQPLIRPDLVASLAARRIAAFALDAIPRTTLAQSMDVLSSMSTIAGYRAAIIAAERLNRFFPMLMTAAGTVAPARVLVLGAGVAGLMACATAKRLGAVVEATDVRAAAREQVLSVGAKFLEVPGTETGDAAGGYAREMSDEYKRRQAELIASHIARADAVIPTALIPGKKAPVLISAEQVKSMKPGSVIVDLAAEMGGNCALTVPGEEVVRHGVVIVGHTNLASTMGFHASQMFSKNVEKYLLHLTDGQGFKFDMADEITRGSLITRDGAVVQAGE